ncbi:MAG: FGGY family carbohydrate kinase [Clostridiales bacterium]|nr:FGGY family carbohydrate kinase [Clostridiales bacterium]
MSILGLDIGTSGCKATIVAADGAVLAEASREYALVSPQPGWEELDPDLVWTQVQAVIGQVTAAYRDDKIRAIGVSSFGEAVVAVDRHGRVLCNSMLYIDSRGREEADKLRNDPGDTRVLAIAGTYIQPMFSLCKIMWLKEHRPEIYRQTWKFLLFADFILFRLGARPATDYSLAARTMAFDIWQKDWSDELLDAAGIDREKFAEPVPSGTLLGKIEKALAGELGLPGDVILAAGGHDQACAALGAGVVRPGLAVDGLGSTECITPAFARPLLTPAMASNHFACVPHVLPGLYVTYAFTFTGGSLLKWFRDRLGLPYRLESEKSGINAYTLMIERALASPGPSPILVLPHFAGAATPYMDAGAQGLMAGLTIDTGPEAMIRGILEGITFEIMVNVEKLAGAGVIIESLAAVGGLARSEPFLQLKADMMGIPVTRLFVSEAGTLGVAILAGTACGVFRSHHEAAAGLVRTDRVFAPDACRHAQYQERFATYKKLYPLMQELRQEKQPHGRTP